MCTRARERALGSGFYSLALCGALKGAMRQEERLDKRKQFIVHKLPVGIKVFIGIKCMSILTK